MNSSLSKSDDTAAATVPEWVSYSFYHDRFKPFEAEAENEPDLVYMIGLFRDGTCKRLLPMRDGGGGMRLGVPGSDGIHWHRVNTRALDPAAEQSCVVELVNPFDVVAIAKVKLSVSGLEHLIFSGCRSYVLTEQPIREAKSRAAQYPAPFDIPSSWLFGSFRPAQDRGEFFLRQSQVTLMLRPESHALYGSPFQIVGGEIVFLESDLLSDDLDGVECYAAHGIMAETHRHIFVGVAKRTDILAYLDRVAADSRRAQAEDDRQIAETCRRKEVEKQFFASGLRFDPSGSEQEFNKRNANGVLAGYWTEFKKYLTNIEETRFPRRVVSLMMKDSTATLENAARAAQEELARFALKKLIAYAAAAEKATLG